MRRFFAAVVACVILACCLLPAAAADGQVVYSKNSKKFFFQPGSDYAPTDLFPEFKDVMPGDSIQQKIKVKNDVANKCKVKLYMRALGAHDNSVDFLSQLTLTVYKNTDTFLFDAPADQKGQLGDWVYLGTLYSGGECELTVTLGVPVTMDNQFQNMVGYLDWEFAVEELPIEPGDPEVPKTGDSTGIVLWFVLSISSLAMMMILLFGKKKKENA